MPAWLTRLALLFLGVVATARIGAAVLGAASAHTEVADLLVTCLSCGEKWVFTPSATFGAALVSLARLRKPADTCPRCGSRVVAFGHIEEDARQHHGHQGRSA